MVNIQNWINENYSDFQIEEIYNGGKELQGDLIIENYPNLKKIILTNAKQITKLVVRNCPAVERIDVYNSKISDLDISELANLEYLQIGNNQLTKLNVSQNKKLKTLICFNNPLETLEGVDKLAELSYFNASNAWKINNNLGGQANLSGDYSYWPAEIQQKRRELESLRSVFEESASLLSGEIKNLEKNQVQTLENKIRELELKEVNYQNQIQDLEKEKEKNLQEINDLSVKKGELEREIKEVKNNLLKTKEKIKKLENDLEKEKSDYRKKIAKKDEEIRELKEKLEQETKKFEEEKNRIITELNSIKKEIPNETEKKLLQFATWSSWEEDDAIQAQEVLKELETGEGQNIFINLEERIDWDKLTERYVKLRKTFVDLVKITKQKNELAEQSKKLNKDFKNLSGLLGTENNLESLKKKLNDNQEEIKKVKKEKERLQEEEKRAQKLFKIEEIEFHSDYIRLELNKPVHFQDDDSEDRIYLANRYPFNQYRVGDELEINAEELRKKSCSENLNDISWVKKVARGKMSLHDWWEEKKITYSERQKLLGISEIDASLWFSLLELKKLLHYESLVEKNREKINIEGKIWRVILFSTWFNKDCIMVVNGQPDNEYDYSVSLIIYEFPLRNMPEILEVIRFPETYSEVEDITNAVFSLEARLNSNNPIIYKVPSLELLHENEYRLLNIKEINIYSVSNDLKDNPDKYIKPLDIAKTFESSDNLHTVVYLGNKKACHVLDNNAIIEWREFFNYHSYPSKIIRYHPIIPYKNAEKIVEHIAKANLAEEKYNSARNGFDLYKNNCEHFANLCVLGLDLSEHVEINYVKHNKPDARKIKKIELKKEIEKNDKFLGGLISGKEVEKKIKEITKWVKKEKSNKNSEESLEAHVMITPKDGYYIKK